MLLALALALAAQADVDTDDWAPTTSGPMASLTAPITPPSRLTLQPLALAVLRYGTYDEVGTLSATAIDPSLVTQLFVEAGLLESLAVGMQAQSIASSSASGVGDTLLFARVYWHDALHGPHPAATWIVQLTLPTGDDRQGLGDGAVVATSGASFSLYLEPVIWHGDTLFSLPLTQAPDHELRASAQWTLAVEVPCSLLDDKLALLLELTGRHQRSDLDLLLSPNAGAPEHEVTLGVGVEVIMTDELQALVGWQRTMWGRNVDAVDTFVVTLVPLL